MLFKPLYPPGCDSVFGMALSERQIEGSLGGSRLLLSLGMYNTDQSSALV